MRVGPSRSPPGGWTTPSRPTPSGSSADGRTLVYSGDTAKSDELIEFAAGADLLVCEAAFRDDATTTRRTST